ncbi:DsbA family protein [Ottowia thiooxydans]|uniref:2-hydroxychromene-2-carboxylate isomerase n=1 Tax=Ottowia thiooxydans TaxID=219182 RepID=A0ABV2Q7D2_9BURK
MSGQNERTVDVFIDLRSPYSYLAIQPARELANERGVVLDWWPFVTDFEAAYGGKVEERSPRDVAKLKYLYMDCRRLAKAQGLHIRATTKLWDATLASQALLFAKSKQRLWEFCDPLLAAFWRREFDLESPTQVAAALAAAGLNTEEWTGYQKSRAMYDLRFALARGEQLGVFGAPTFVWQGELFWGGDRLPLLQKTIGSDAQLDSTPPDRL